MHFSLWKTLGLVQSWSPALWKIVLVLHIVVAQWTLLLRCFDLFFLQCNVLLVLHYCCSSVHWLLQGAMLYLFSTVVAQFIWRCNVDASGAVFWFLPGWPRLHLPPDSSQYSQCSRYCYLLKVFFLMPPPTPGLIFFSILDIILLILLLPNIRTSLPFLFNQSALYAMLFKYIHNVLVIPAYISSDSFVRFWPIYV